MVRKKRVLHSIDISKGVGLEIGPLTAPILSKDEAKVLYVDHLSKEELREKYKAEPVDLDSIVDVDYVVEADKKLSETVKNKKFDFIIASHVIEHIPNLIDWLNDLFYVLKPGGMLSLVIPDKRATFDINRRTSDFSEILGAYYDKLEKPNSAMMYDFASKCVENVNSEEAWRGKDYSNAKNRWTHKEAVKMCLENLKPDKYVDLHCYTFTPHSFIKILSELTEKGYIKYKVDHFLETQPGELEFYVALKRPTHSITKDNLLKSLPEISEFSFRKDVKIVALENKLAKLEKDIISLTSSTSWRLTRPLRMVSKKLHKK